MIKLPSKYKSILSTRETEHAIIAIKDFFQLALSTELNLYRVTLLFLLGLEQELMTTLTVLSAL